MPPLPCALQDPATDRRDRPGRQLVLYDGVCGLCDRTVQFLLGADRRRVLHFAPLQGPTAAAARRRHPQLAGVDSVVFLRDEGTAEERAFQRSQAAVELLAAVGGRWLVASWMLRIVPPPLRDLGYDIVARNRYGWFGKLESCRLPSPETRSRFLE